MSGKKWNAAVVSRAEQRLQKRQAVLEAAVTLFNDRGYSQTSLDDIAHDLNVTKRTLYYYVESKEEILRECLRIGTEFVEQMVRRCADDKAPPLDRIEMLVKEYGRWLAQDHGAVIVLTKESSISPELRVEVRKAKARIDTCLRQMIQQGVDDGTITPCDPAITAAAIFGALNWIPYWNREADPEPYDKVTSEFLRLFLDGLRPAGPRSD